MSSPAILPEEQFELLYRQHHQEVLAVAVALLGDRDDGEDLAAETWVMVWSQWEELRMARHPRRSVQAVLAVAAKQLLAVRHGEQALAHLLADLAELQSPKDPDSAAIVDVRTATHMIAMGRRICLVLRYGFDWPDYRVAELLGVAVSTVRNQARSGVADVRRLLTSQSLRQDPPLRPRVVVLLGTRRGKNLR